MSQIRTGTSHVGPLAVTAFLAELVMIVGLAYAGARLADAWPVALLLAVILPAVAMVVWGLWCAPRAGHRLARLPRVAVKTTLFSVTLLLLLGTPPQPLPGVVGLVMWLGFVISVPAETA